MNIKKLSTPFAVLLLLVNPSFALGSNFNDVHFHLTNYIQEGITLKDFMKIMNEANVDRAAVFGIPLQQKWDYHVSADRDPEYYLESNAPLYYYSFVDSIIAHEYNTLTEEEKKKVDPMITGFNPTDMYAADHIRRVMDIYPGVFTGIGEFSVHKEFVSAKVTGHTANLRNKALDRIFELVTESGLIALIHVDINNLRSDDIYVPSHFKDVRNLFKRNKDATIIWAHTGLGRFVSPTKDHLDLLESLINDPDLENLYFDIAWDEVAKYVVQDEQSTADWAELINKHPTKFLFGTDAVAPKNVKHYTKTYVDYGPLWDKLSDNAKELVKSKNYERLFDAARVKVRKWEQEQHKAGS